VIIGNDPTERSGTSACTSLRTRLHLPGPGTDVDLERGERATDVAALAGFAYQSHLNRHFRRRLGMTPARYARTLAGV
jgi:AraC-like DNA-binding protein